MFLEQKMSKFTFLLALFPMMAVAGPVDFFAIDPAGNKTHCVADHAHVNHVFNNPVVRNGREIVTVQCAGPISHAMSTETSPFSGGLIRLNIVGPSGLRSSCSVWSAELSNALSDTVPSGGDSYTFARISVRCSDTLLSGFVNQVDLKN